LDAAVTHPPSPAGMTDTRMAMMKYGLSPLSGSDIGSAESAFLIEPDGHCIVGVDIQEEDVPASPWPTCEDGRQVDQVPHDITAVTTALHRRIHGEQRDVGMGLSLRVIAVLPAHVDRAEAGKLALQIQIDPDPAGAAVYPPADIVPEHPTNVIILEWPITDGRERGRIEWDGTGRRSIGVKSDILVSIGEPLSEHRIAPAGPLQSVTPRVPVFGGDRADTSRIIPFRMCLACDPVPATADRPAASLRVGAAVRRRAGALPRWPPGPGIATAWPMDQRRASESPIP
jgi:hypothetical protein